MRQRTARPNAWRLENWSVRAKIAAAVAVPLVAALALGGLRVFGDLDVAQHQRDNADRIAIMPAVVDLETKTNRAALGKIFRNAELTARWESEMDQSLAAARAATGRSSLDPAIKARLNEMITAGDTVRAAQGPSQQLLEARNKQTDAAIDLVRVAAGPIDDGRLQELKAQMIETWQAKRAVMSWALGAIPLLANPRQPMPPQLIAADAAEAALLESLDRGYPAMAGETKFFREVINARRAAVDDARVTGVFSVPRLAEILLPASDRYNEMVQSQAVQIRDTADDRASAATSEAVRSVVLIAGALLIALLLAFFVARALVRPIRRLQRATRDVAETHLPDEIARLDGGESLDTVQVGQVATGTSEEVGQLADAVDDLHARALSLAGGQAELRRQVNDMFETMARRNKSLVERQLGLIESLEYDEKDPARLESLFRLDHLAARMRRNSDNLMVLADTKSRAVRTAPLEIRDVLRAALSEVEDYQRVKTGACPDGSIVGAAATDVVHLLSELVENALQASPPSSDVTILYSPTAEGGLLIEIVDTGIGVPKEQLEAINARLTARGGATPATTRRMGLFVVGRLADRHGITVRLRRTYDSGSNPGITASVHLPSTLIAGPIAERVQRSAGTAQPARIAPQPTAGPLPAVSQPLPAVSQPIPAALQAAPVEDDESDLEKTVVTSAGLPLRQPGTTEIPKPLGSVPPLPPRGAGRELRANGQLPDLPQRGPGDLPQRSGDLPQRGPGDLPRRTPAGLPQRTPVDRPAADVAAELSQSNGGLPQRLPGSTISTHRISTTPAAGDLPSDAASVPTTTPPTPPAAALRAERPVGLDVTGRHRFRIAKTASFFQSRIDGPMQEPPAVETPIFAGMVSAWLSDPTTGEWELPKSWNDVADEGWSAAQRASEAAITQRTEVGLPQRDPGVRLVPGGVSNAPAGESGPTPRRRDPEAIRANLSRHQRGVRDGRGASNLSTSVEGER